jgi:hypothetical protein
MPQPKEQRENTKAANTQKIKNAIVLEELHQ